MVLFIDKILWIISDKKYIIQKSYLGLNANELCTPSGKKRGVPAIPSSDPVDT